MDEIVFQGVVCTGVGWHSRLFVPGRGELAQADSDWPLVLQPGSLNVRVHVHPPEFRARGLSSTVQALDRAWFAPAFEILRDEFGNNTIRSSPGMPRRGDAQVWRARLITESAVIGDCWILRRFGSGVGEQLEFVADRYLRDEGLYDDQPVNAILCGHWKTSGPIPCPEPSTGVGMKSREPNTSVGRIA